MKRLYSKKSKGFTLIELIIVIAILAVLAAIALPRYNNSKRKSVVTAHNSNVKVLESAALNYVANGGLSVTWPEDLSYKDYVKNYPKVPKGIEELKAQSGTPYKVTISDKGDVTVTPAMIEENEK
ncbi:prepilin-type N-terminal cleavage/methylation domain-containing protein [Lagierella sp.]|uniref:prepilin-type N-terminal cleavage/methylation domain-containing protein n=1 Tax=Lagierella sp. TaxID=2849657 RepID=UPI0026080C35|nr:prepilin-type N-terminal cleavage/methylation domain-containing protein [Lagierella sp.]